MSGEPTVLMGIVSDRPITFAQVGGPQMGTVLNPQVTDWCLLCKRTTGQRCAEFGRPRSAGGSAERGCSARRTRARYECAVTCGRSDIAVGDESDRVGVVVGPSLNRDARLRQMVSGTPSLSWVLRGDLRVGPSSRLSRALPTETPTPDGKLLGVSVDQEDTLPPPRGATIWRNTARVIPIRRSDHRCLLLHGWDPDHPDQPFWFTVGGGAEEGEDLRQAAVRELAEEVGVTASAGELLGPLVANQITFDWAGRHLVQDQTFFALGVDDVEVSFDGQEALEVETIDSHGWFTYGELAATGATFPEVLEAMALAVDAVAPQ